MLIEHREHCPGEARPGLVRDVQEESWVARRGPTTARMTQYKLCGFIIVCSILTQDSINEDKFSFQKTEFFLGQT